MWLRIFPRLFKSRLEHEELRNIARREQANETAMAIS
jgi:hypothetical protein